MSDLERPGDERGWGTGESESDDIEQSSENVLEGWPATSVDEPPEEPAEPESFEPDAEPEPGPEPAAEPEVVEEPSIPEPGLVPAELPETSSEHAPGELEIPPGYAVLEGEPRGGRRAVGIVVSRFNGEVTGRLLDSALEELETRGVEAGSITVMPVPGAFELPLAAMALAKTRRFACVVALGCVIRGDTPHFDYVASEAASGLQLAGIETGVPVAFGLLTCDTIEQAEARVERGAVAARTALEMADVFAQVRAPR